MNHFEIHPRDSVLATFTRLLLHNCYTYLRLIWGQVMVDCSALQAFFYIIIIINSYQISAPTNIQDISEWVQQLHWGAQTHATTLPPETALTTVYAKLLHMWEAKQSHFVAAVPVSYSCGKRTEMMNYASIKRSHRSIMTTWNVILWRHWRAVSCEFRSI